MIMMKDQSEKKEALIQELVSLRKKIAELEQSESERKKAEGYLQEHDIRLKKLYSWVPGMIYQFTRRPDGTYCVPFTTAAIKDIFGCSPQDVREDFSPIAKVILPEDFDKVFGSIEYSAKHLTIWTCEYRVQIPGQSIRWLLGNSAPEKLADGSITWYGFNTDITERKQAEEAFQINLLKYQTLFEMLPIGVTISEKTGKIIDSNREAERLLGLQLKEQVKRTIAGQEWGIIRPDGSPMPADEYASVRAIKENRLIENVEMGIVKGEGDVTWINVAAAPIPLEGYGVAIAYSDITERKHVEDALRQSEEQYHSLFENMQEGFAYYRMIFVEGQPQDLLYLNVNKAFEKLTGLKDVVGRKITEVIPGIKEANPELLEIYGRVALTGKPEKFEDYFEPLKAWLFISVYSPAKGYCVAVFDNITERKKTQDMLRESESRYRHIFDGAIEGMYRTSLQGTSILVNRAHAKLLGYDSPQEVVCTIVDSARQVWADPDERSHFIQLHENQDTVRAYECRFKRKDGTKIWVSLNSRAVRGPDGQVVYFEGFCEDITERKRAEEALRESQSIQRAVFDSTTDFIWSVDPQGGLLTFNRSISDYFLQYRSFRLQVGQRPEDMFTNADDIDRWHGYYQRVLASGPFTAEYTVHSGIITLLMTFNVLMRDEVIFGVSVFGKDITDRKKAEEALRESEQNFRRSLDDSPLGVRIVTIEGDTIYANPAILDIYGYDSLEELKITPVKKRYTPESYAEYQIRREKRKRGDYSQSEYEISIVRKDGTVRHLYVFRKEVIWDGERQFQVLYNDITKRKLAEEALREAHERAEWLARFPEENPNPVMRVSANGSVRYYNQASVKLSGWACKDGQRLPDPLLPIFGQAMTSGKEIQQDVELGERFYSVAVVPIHEKGYANVYGRDITERKRAEEALKASHQQLHAFAGRLQSVREEQRKEIAREIHDDLGGALTALKIDLSFLASSAPKSRDKTKRDSFLSKMLDMTKLIDETIGTVRRLVTQLRPSILDDFGLFAALEWQLQEFQKRMGIQSEFVSSMEYINLDEELSIAVFRIFQEALTNVARHANATKVTATLYEEADSLVLKVEDNGKGISADDIHNTKSVGLIGMRERALFLGATVNFSGEPSKGTTVILKIPQDKKHRRRRDSLA